MTSHGYRSMPPENSVDRRAFMKIGGTLGAGLIMSRRSLLAAEQEAESQAQTPPAGRTPPRPATNVQDALKVPRTRWSLPGPFPGRVIEVADEKAMPGGKPDALIIKTMFEKGIRGLTGKDLKESFGVFFEAGDIVGLKVNPVGPGFMSTRLELVDAVAGWLESNGLPRKNIIIWDRFDYMLKDAGFTTQRFPGLGIEGLQTMDEAAAQGRTRDNSRWLRPDGTHVSVPNFDQNVSYWVDVEGPKDLPYLNQDVFNGKHSYFGRLLTDRLTKIVNLAVFKNSGNAISMATKNIGYGSVCNTSRLHAPLFLDVCVEVAAFAPIRDKMVLNITDGLRSQYDGGPDSNAKFAYIDNRLYFASDPFALDIFCHNKITAKRKEMGVAVNENPRFTEYLRYAERLGLGVTDPRRIQHVRV